MLKASATQRSKIHAGATNDSGVGSGRDNGSLNEIKPLACQKLSSNKPANNAKTTKRISLGWRREGASCHTQKITIAINAGHRVSLAAPITAISQIA